MLGGKSIADQPLGERRAALEQFFAANSAQALQLSPATTDRETALGWLERSGGALDGVIAKRLDLPYRHGERAMIKVKQRRTADCVVGGFRYASKRREVGSLLLGLYDEDGILHHVGFTSAIPRASGQELTEMLEELVGGAGFTGRAPGGPSRWSNARSGNGSRSSPNWSSRSATTRSPTAASATARRCCAGAPTRRREQCTFEQLAPALNPAKLKALFG